MTNTNNIMKIESEFYRSLGNGVKSLGYIKDMILSVVDSRDTTVLSRAILRAGNKGDNHADRALRLAISQVFEGAKMVKKPTGGGISIKISGTTVSEAGIKRLKDAATSGLSIRSSAYAKILKGTKDEDEKSEFDVKAWAVRMKKAHKDDLGKMIAALQAVSKEA